MSYKTHRIKLCFVLMMALGGLQAGCQDKRRAATTRPETLSNISVIAVQKRTVPDWLEAVGTVRATQTSQISSQVMGNILEIRAHEGDLVRGGQVLATIDDAQSRSAVDQASAAVTAAEEESSAAESEFALAGATLNRYQQLYEKKSVSSQEFEEIQARYRSTEARRDMARAKVAQAKAGLARARTSLGYTRVRAPFTGIVTEKKADAGTLAGPGMPLFTLEDTRSYRLEVAVDESGLRLVRLGQTGLVTIDALGSLQTSGRVVQIVPAADAASRSFLVKIELPAEARLRSGIFGRARFSRGERSALLIPQTSLVERGQLQGVYVLDANQIAGLRYVTLGEKAGEQVEVLSGLQGGEQLLVAPGDREVNGKRIAVRP